MDIQKQFEELYLSLGGKQSELEKENGEYTHSKSQMAWGIWQAAKASVVPEWISVGDRLPEFEQEVLLLSGGERLVAQYLPAAVNEFGIHFDEGFWVNDGASIVDATHWMPLLDLPKAQEPSNDS